MQWRGETVDQFWDRVCEWHSAYAWHPVQLMDGTWLWLERYERRAQRRGPSLLHIRWDCRRCVSKEWRDSEARREGRRQP
jgi:hypothetical protein